MKSIKAFAIVAATTIISSMSYAGNLGVNCYKGLSVNANTPVLLNFEVANNPSNRLISNFNESRSATDSESLPAFLVSQYKFQPLELLVELDDATEQGKIVATLQAIYAGKKSGEVARYLGAYKRVDAGRALSAIVTCIVKEQQ